MSKLLKDRLQKLRAEISTSRSPGAKLIIVSKYVSSESIEAAYILGERDFGENRWQDLAEKLRSLPYEDLSFHFLGALQTNKIPKLLREDRVRYIHSVDSIKKLELIIQEFMRIRRKSALGIFLQLNISNEDSKGGFPSLNASNLAEIGEAVSTVKSSPLDFCGLMGMGPSPDLKATREEEVVRTKNAFEKLREIGLKLDKSCKFSMGMSADYQVALEVGTDFLRPGSLIWRG